MKPGRVQIHYVIDASLKKGVARLAAKTNVTETSVIEAALVQHLHGTRDLTLLYRRLDAISRALERVHGRVEQYGELVNQFVKLWLINTPQLSRGDSEATGRVALGRYQRLRAAATKAISAGHRFVDALPQESLSPPQTDALDSGSSTKPRL